MNLSQQGNPKLEAWHRFPATKKQHSLLTKRGLQLKKAVVVSVDDEVVILSTSVDGLRVRFSLPSFHTQVIG